MYDEATPQSPTPLAHFSDRDVVAVYEKASETYDELAMAAAADEMQRRNLDY